jgi:hypothetical protein
MVGKGFIERLDLEINRHFSGRLCKSQNPNNHILTITNYLDENQPRSDHSIHFAFILHEHQYFVFLDLRMVRKQVLFRY